MLFLIFVGYFAVRIYVGVNLRKKTDPKDFPVASNKIYAISSFIFGTILMFYLQGQVNFWGKAVGWLLLADSFFSCIVVIHGQKRK